MKYIYTYALQWYAIHAVYIVYISMRTSHTDTFMLYAVPAVLCVNGCFLGWNVDFVLKPTYLYTRTMYVMTSNRVRDLVITSSQR